jgi:DNA-binding CsgD family transcriptional regulator
LAKEKEYLAEANRLWKEGLSTPKIAAIYKMKSNSMSWWIHRGRQMYGLFPRRPGQGHSHSTAHWRKVLREPHRLWRSGVTYTNIAAICGINRRTLTTWRKVGQKLFGWFDENTRAG